MFCIAGADGFFGAYIQKLLLSRSEKVLALNHRAAVFPDSELLTNIAFEISDEACLETLKEYLLKEREEIYIIYLIACHDPDKVKKDPENAEKINCFYYERFLKEMRALGADKLYYASSDTVYGESENGAVFTEKSATVPVNVYGSHKLAAEELTKKYGYRVVRFPYMYAPSLCAKKHFFDTLTDTLTSGGEIDMFGDYIRSTLTYPTAAKYLYKLMLSDNGESVVNICADRPVSKYEIGLTAARYCGADISSVKCISMEDSGVFTEKRAGSIVMSNELLKKITGDESEIRNDEFN